MWTSEGWRCDKCGRLYTSTSAVCTVCGTPEEKKENNMKFMIITTNGTYFIESEDFESAANEVYDTHTGYDDVVGIIKIEE